MDNKGDRKMRLLAMLKQVDPDNYGAELLRDSLESSSEAAVTEGPVLDVAMRSGEKDLALESLDILVKDNAEDLSAERAFALEAIVMPFHRPVVDIVGGKMMTHQLQGKWLDLGKGVVRQRIEALFPSIGRVEVHNHPTLPYAGTGFIVATNKQNDGRHTGVIMTNRHVADAFASGLGERKLDFIAGRSSSVDFLRELGSQDSSETSKTTFEVEGIQMIHPYWDMALLEVSGLSVEHQALTLGVRHPEDFPAEQKIVTIGYPGYDPSGDAEFQATQNRIFRGVYYVKRFQPGILRERAEVNSYDRPVLAMTHDCSTLGGNSGSAVVTVPNDGEDPVVIGLHFAGAYLRANYAVPAHDLALDSRVVDAGVQFDGQVEPHKAFYQNYWRGVDLESSGSTRSGQSETELRTGLTQPPMEIELGEGATWRIPLEVTVKLGAPAIVAKRAPAVQPDTQFEGLFRRAPKPIPLAELETKFSVDSLFATSFEWKTALSLAAASKLVYESRSTVESVATAAWGLDTCQFFRTAETESFIASKEKVVLISFRGTAGTADWLGNLDLFSRHLSYGKVHGGFHKAFGVVKAELKGALTALSPERVLLTGHSLGGALAVIAAAEWQISQPIGQIYTYGQPAVGKGGFTRFMARHYGPKYSRFVNDDDIVPRVPPGYDHVGKLFHLRDGKTESVVSAEPAPLSEAEFDKLQAACAEQAARNESLGGVQTEGLPSIRDHGMDNYIREIEERA